MFCSQLYVLDSSEGEVYLKQRFFSYTSFDKN